VRGTGCHPPGVIHHAYLRWLLTQGMRPDAEDLDIGTDGWLFATKGLHQRRSPGTTCVSALVGTKGFCHPLPAENRSKGCGGVMRIAPVGLFSRVIGGLDEVFVLGSDAAALTHGHPAGHLAAGYLAVVIAALAAGDDLPRALDHADAVLATRAEGSDVARAVDGARRLAQDGSPSAEKVESLGGGWVAEEALAIALYCALIAPDFASALLLAVNHSGDSDSTGALTGNLLGARDGLSVVPPAWLADLELRDAIDRIALDLDAVACGRVTADEIWTAYPGW
jgi:ADP-ribosylglycohydrolase